MAVYDYAGYRFHSKGALSPVGTKTLIISSHGVQTGGTFSKAYTTVIQFAAPKGSLLVAGLGDAIKGNITATEVALKSGAPADDYKLSYYEHDPSDHEIGALLTDKSDVLTFSQSYTNEVMVKLSSVLVCLKQWGLMYPGILCLFCRGQQRHLRPVEGGKPYAPSYHGGQHAAASVSNQHQINATALMLEMKAKGLSK
ncbi:MAG TPA: hypothetical protein DEH78_19690 [Solibacterales bacterium]|nr:hypothetical protein [Bryobacterales bacterium]